MSKILYVEDDEGLWALVRHTLSKRQLQVIGAHDLAEARSLMEVDNFDLALVDHELPDGKGLQFLETYAAGLPCIMLTGVGNEQLAVDCLKLGAKDYIVKDVQSRYLDILPNAVTRALHEVYLRHENREKALALERARQRLRAVFDSAPDLMIITNADCTIVDISTSTAEDYGIDVEQAEGASLQLYLPAATLAELVERRSAGMETRICDIIPVFARCKRLDCGSLLFVFRSLVEQFRAQEAIAHAAFVEHEKQVLQQENRALVQVLEQQKNRSILGQSRVVEQLVETIRSVAVTDATVLITGETGTGKELIANEIHRHSSRSDGPFVKLNCASIPGDLVESELFGHEKGAFTGAYKKHEGKFLQANGGTLFLDEIGELDLAVQSKLLRVLQEGEVQPVGSDTTGTVDVRLLAATNRDLEPMIERGHFRADLYYRLHVVPVHAPPLRERVEDIPLLAEFFLRKYMQTHSICERKFSDEQIQLLCRYHWPGNIRELQNTIERFVILGQVDAAKLKAKSGGEDPVADFGSPRLEPLDAVEKRHINRVLDACDWVVSGDKGAAKVLGLNPSTLRFRMQKLGIVKKRVS